MANESKKRKTAATPAKEVREVPAPAVEQAAIKPTVTNIDPHQFVTVRNGFQGRLAYQSKKTGELFVWESFGDEQEMEIGELRSAKSSNKKFFVKNWFMFDEPWIIEYLGVSQYYKFAVSIEDFDNVFSMPLEEMEETLQKLSDGQKASMAYRARQLIAEGAIDSNKAIAALEKYLGVELIER